MKHMTKWLPPITLIAGVCCGYLRHTLFCQADDRGLLPAGQLTGTMLAVIAVALGLLLALYLLKGSASDYRILLKIPVRAVGCLLAAAGFVYWFLTCSGVWLGMILTLICAALFLILGFHHLQRKKPPLLVFALICICMMGLCFVQYRSWGRFTQPMRYLFPALSALTVMLYSLEACYMELPQRKAKKAFFLHQAALFFSLGCLNEENRLFYGAICLWLICELFSHSCRMTLPQDVLELMAKLEKADFSVYAVGGCVRDAMLGLAPKDYDLCTDATPEQLCQVFDGFELVRNGEKHGTIGVVHNRRLYEITTFRTESGYADHRHPDSVEFVRELKQDLARRDFTVNAMAYHPKTGYIDYFGGEKDLFYGVLRTVGDPKERFQEDGLRILRGVRFACRYRLAVEETTAQAMQELAPLLDTLARERVASELTQILCAMERGDLIRFRSVILQAVPCLAATVDFHQHSPHHAYDVFTHTDAVLCATAPVPALRWAALLHDVGKPAVFTQDEKGRGHFYGHAQESARIAQELLQSLKLSRELQEQVLFLVEHHMDTLAKASLRKKLSKYGLSSLEMLIALQRADQAGKGKGKSDSSFDKLEKALQQLEKEEGRLQIRDLQVDGHDLMAIGYEAGPELGQCQKTLLELVLSGQLPNEKQALLDKAKALLEEEKDT